jgi:hypothetical protein
MPKTYRWMSARLGDYSTLIELCGAEPLRQEDWDARNEVAATHFRERHRDASLLRTIVFSDGGHPDARQRKQLVSATGGQATKQAVITIAISNPIIQGVVTALAWLNPSAKAVGPDRWRDAMAHVDLAPHLDEILNHMEDLQRDMPPNKTLALILELTGRKTRYSQPK